MGRIFQRKKKLANGTIKVLPTWWIRYRRGGRAFDESSGSTQKAVAKTLLKLREADIARGLAIDPRIGRLTFEQAAENLLNEYEANGRKSRAQLKGRIRQHLQPFFGGRRMATIMAPMVRTYAKERLDGGAAPGTVNRELSALKRMFTLACQDGVLLSRPHIPMLRERNTRTGFFSPQEVEAVIRQLRAPLKPVIRFAFTTGWRIPSEVLLLEWRQVDFEAGVVRLEVGSTKNDRGREFPFSVMPVLADLLTQQRVYTRQVEQRRGQIVPQVFHRDGKPIRDFRRAWETACRAAGCPGRIPHDLRRSAVRALEHAGVSRAVAMSLTGHLTESVYRRYAIVADADLRQGVAKLSAALDRAEGARRQPGVDKADSSLAVS